MLIVVINCNQHYRVDKTFYVNHEKLMKIPFTNK